LIRLLAVLGVMVGLMCGVVVAAPHIPAVAEAVVSKMDAEGLRLDAETREILAITSQINSGNADTLVVVRLLWDRVLAHMPLIGALLIVFGVILFFLFRDARKQMRQWSNWEEQLACLKQPQYRSWRG
jgi:small basic protein